MKKYYEDYYTQETIRKGYSKYPTDIIETSEGCYNDLNEQARIIYMNGYQDKSKITVWQVFVFIAIIIAVAVVLSSCVKAYSSNEKVVEVKNKFQCIIDSYNYDTTILEHRTLLAQYYLPLNSNTFGMDTITDKFFFICGTNKIEHVYYVVNDKKVYDVGRPCSTPIFIDTNFINYKIN